MSEIEKLMQNAGIEPEQQDCCKIADKYWAYNTESGFEYLMQKECPYNQECTDECEYAYDKVIYPEFTAEKQIELIRYIALNDNIDYVKYYYQAIKGVWVFVCVTVTELASEMPKVYCAYHEGVGQALAGLINNLWQDLTEEEKAEIKEILK